MVNYAANINVRPFTSSNYTLLYMAHTNWLIFRVEPESSSLLINWTRYRPSSIHLQPSEIHVNMIFPSPSRSSKWLLSNRFPQQNSAFISYLLHPSYMSGILKTFRFNLLLSSRHCRASEMPFHWYKIP